MKFKKTVSAAAALAMSVSAFAGIGITARAATAEGEGTSYQIPAGKVIGDVVWGTKSSTTSVTPESFDTEGSSTGTWTNDNHGNVSIAATTKTSQNYYNKLSNNALSFYRRNTFTVNYTYTLQQPISSGTVVFSATMFTDLRAGRIGLYSSDGTSIFDYYVPDENGAAQSEFTINGALNHSQQVRSRGSGEKINYVVIDFDNDTIEYSYTYYLVSSTTSGIFTRSDTVKEVGLDGKDIASLKVQTSGANSQLYVDDISLYTIRDSISPDFALSTNSVSLEEEGNASVTLSDVVGDISLSNFDTSIINATYDRDSKTIAITGISAGNTSITVTGSNDGLTTSKTISVEVTDASPAPTELTADATLASSFIDADNNESQVWEASIESSAGTTLSKLQATATYTTDSDPNTTLTNSSNELDITDITGEAGVYAAVVLENTQDVNISGVTVTLK